MSKYYGTVIHKTLRDGETLAVVESRGMRSLYFDEHAIQSRMNLKDPTTLVLAYTRAMLSGLLFQPEPKRILLIGLGGGSQAKFLLENFPETQLDVVEYNQDVVMLAQRFFFLPKDTEKLHIHIGDGADYLQNGASADIRYDLILIDAFDKTGPVQTIHTPAFFQACQQHLAPDGAITINLWNDKKSSWRKIAADLKTALTTPVYHLIPTQDPDNLILVAPSQTPPSRRQLRQRAKSLISRLDVEFLAFLRGLQCDDE